MRKTCLYIVFVAMSLLHSMLPAQNLPPQRDALVLYNNGQYAEAIAVCEEELHTDPTRVDAYVVMCWALIGNRQYVEAEQRAQDGLQVHPYDLRLVESLAEAYYYLGRNTAAMEQFERYVSNVPENNGRVSTAYYFMSELYIRQGRYQHADISLSMAVRKRPTADTWWVRLGYVRERAGNYTEALEAYDEAVRLNPLLNDAIVGQRRVSSRLQ
ncbi:MAG: tetratricopeptide repeat protein [Treponema sp.]|nr:tetratricopeptide repeat protein [Treponema sp.]